MYGFCVHIQTFCTFVYGFCACYAVFAYIYGWSVAQVLQLLRTHTAVVCVERLLCMYTAYLLCMLCGFCVRMRFIFMMFKCGQSWGIQYFRFLDFFCPWERSWFVDSLRDPILRVASISLSARAARYYWIVLRIRSWGFPQLLCTIKLLVIKRLILPQRFLVGLDRAIYFPCGVILLCTMLLYRRRYEGYFGCTVRLKYLTIKWAYTVTWLVH